jgi:hypothetical protein
MSLSAERCTTAKQQTSIRPYGQPAAAAAGVRQLLIITSAIKIETPALNVSKKWGPEGL